MDKSDSNNGVDSQYTRLVVNQAQLTKQQMSVTRYKKESMLPRLMWINKSLTLKQVHHQVFRYFRQVLTEWVDWKDPETAKVPKDPKFDLR